MHSTERDAAEKPGSGQVNIVVIPHSHWDREWYATFEEFRFYLVEFVDELLELLETDEGFRSFLMDGQVSLLEDYLEVRPENGDRLRRLIREGRIEIGPWYVQPDEFLISGEALVRNLLLGDRAARSFGPVMKQGYVPDTFGHISQLPQVLRGFGIDAFYFMRGLGEDVSDLRAEFWWEAPDGSRVLAHFLSETYSNAAILGPDPKKISFRHDRLSDPSSYFVSYDSLFELRDRLLDRSADRTILLLNGSDHVTVQPRFSGYVFDLNHSMNDHVFNGTLGDFQRLVLRDNPELNTYRGELISARYQPILRGTLSSRIYLKQRNEQVQQLLEGLAERASVIAYSLGGRDYAPFLKYAWRELIKNHAHDSIGGCSADAVHCQMMGRFETATRVGRKVVAESLDYLASRVAPTPEPDVVPIVVFNPSPWERGGSVRVEVSTNVDVPFRRRIFDWIGQRKLDLETSVLVDQEGNEVRFDVRGETLHIEDALYRRKAVRRTTIEFEVAGAPPLGYKVYRLTNSPEGERRGRPDEQTPVDGMLENEFLRVRARGDGTLEVLEKGSGRRYPGVNRLVDEGDAGDEYNFSPPRAQQDEPLSPEAGWEVEVGEDPRTLVLRGELNLPKGLSADRSSRSEELVRCPVVTHVRLPFGSRRVEIKTEFYNRARDHRLRVAFPSGSAAEESVAESAFGTARRPTRPQDGRGWREKDTAAYAQRRFVCVEDGDHGLAVLNKGLPEYEVTPEGEIRLTLLRSVGWLSRSDLVTRVGHAGPELATPEAQCSGRQVFEYAVLPYAGSWQEAGIYREAEEYWLPLEARAAQQGDRTGEPSPEGAPGSFLSLSGRDVVLSSIKKGVDKDGMIVRLFNASDTATRATLRFGFPISAAYKTNLNEEISEEIAPRGRKVELLLEGAGIETLLVKLHLPEGWAERLRRHGPHD
jgi:mannosylglycerate hydrolase